MGSIKYMETSSNHSNIWNTRVIYTEKGLIYSSIDLLVELILVLIDKYTEDYKDIFKEMGEEVGLSFLRSLCTFSHIWTHA